MFKDFVRSWMERLVRKYFKKHNPRLIVVVGAAGKTTTKVAIATMLTQKFKVRMDSSNHNTDMSVPPAILGVEYPKNPQNPFAWLSVLSAMRKKINQESDVDIIIQELGTDHPGEILHFGKYLRPDLAVVTSILPEHMEFFGTIEEVAREELSVAQYSNILFINRDDVAEEYAKYAKTKRLDTYGIHEPAEYRFDITANDPRDGFNGNFVSPELGEIPAKVHLLGQHNLRAAIIAGALGVKFGLTHEEIKKGLETIRPIDGRMNVLPGRNGTIIIDDTYNSSPGAATAALKTLYQFDAPQLIAILGSMNELGMSSPDEHTKLGDFCDPTQLEYVITIGDDANKYLATAAEKIGNRVQRCKTPMEAGLFVSRIMLPGAVVLAKGSQNGVFAEEAVKVLLANTSDYNKLVRQSLDWLDVKKKQFNK